MSIRSRNERAPARAGSRKEPQPQLTDEQWKLIADLFPEPAPSAQGGRPRRAARECVEGILWVLRSGARWKDLPAHFPSPPTCWRRFQDWTEAGVWPKAWARLLRMLDRDGRIQWEEGIADGTFSSAKKGGCASARPNAGRKRKGDILLFLDLPRRLGKPAPMPRTARASVGNLCYHVLNRGNGRAEVFHKRGDYQAFLQLLVDAGERLPMRVLGYVLMTLETGTGVVPVKSKRERGMVLSTSEPRSAILCYV